jgi:hypothetical protein
MSDMYIWVVESLCDSTPTLLSVHTSQHNALAARDAYMGDGRISRSEADYWVHGMKPDWTGLEEAK